MPNHAAWVTPAFPGQPPQHALLPPLNPGDDLRGKPPLRIPQVESSRKLQPCLARGIGQQGVELDVRERHGLAVRLLVEEPERLLQLLQEAPMQLLPNFSNHRQRPLVGLALVPLEEVNRRLPLRAVQKRPNLILPSRPCLPLFDLGRGRRLLVIAGLVKLGFLQVGVKLLISRAPERSS